MLQGFFIVQVINIAEAFASAYCILVGKQF
jgi:hypothetical protein